MSRVVWTEGMHLAQHHFQAQSRYVEDAAAFALSNLFFRPYGVAVCRMDDEAIRNAAVAVTAARGIMPDGLTFQFPDDTTPSPIHLKEHFPAEAERCVVHLSIPAYRPGGANCATADADEPASARYLASDREMPDETVGGEMRVIQVARKNFRLELDTGALPSDGRVRLPLARVRRDGAGGYTYDEDYVPACIQIGASHRLMELVSRLVEIIGQKATAMTRERAASRSSLSDFASREVASFWFTHVLHTALPELRHFLDAPATHPERLYSSLARLGGALCTFGMETDPGTLPLYDHDALGDCFLGLDSQIRSMLELVIPTNCVHIPLEPFDPQAAQGTVPTAQTGYLVGRVLDDRCLGESQWYLGVQAQLAGAELADRVPRSVKICSAEEISKLVSRALEGPTLTHVPAPPPAISPRMGMEYFRVTLEGPAWQRVALMKSVGIHVPDAIPDPRVELSVVVGS